MTASQMRIAETIDAFYGDAGAKDGVSRSYKQAVEDLDAETIKALDGPYRYVMWTCGCKWPLTSHRTTVLEPISRFCAYFPDVNECMHRFSLLPSKAPTDEASRYQKARPQTPRLRCPARQGQEVS
jgi:amphiphysin